MKIIQTINNTILFYYNLYKKPKSYQTVSTRKRIILDSLYNLTCFLILYLNQSKYISNWALQPFIWELTQSVTWSILAQPVLLFVLHDTHRRLFGQRPAREPVSLVGAVASRYPRRPGRHFLNGFHARFLITQFVLFRTPEAVLSFLRRRSVALPRPLPEASAAFCRTPAPRAPGSPAGLFHRWRRNCKKKTIKL